MYYYLKGKVTLKKDDYIVLEVNDIGYHITVSNILDFDINNIYILYIYDVLKNESINLYGFKSNELKQLFLKIINVKGVGPKTAISMFKDYNEERIIKAINDEDTNFLKKLPNIGLKAAKQIILDLKGKLVNENDCKLSNDLLDVKQALKNLGFKISDIDQVLNDLSKEKHNIDDYLKLALIKLNRKG